MKKEAYFAAGCFWSVEQFFYSQPGVIDTEVGYMNGNEKVFPIPNYEQVCSHLTGYAETVKVVYDPEKITYEKLVELFFKCHDSTQKDRQGPDIGNQYRSAIFYKTDEEGKKAKRIANRESLKLKKKVETEISKAKKFFPAENHHQKYFKSHKVACHI